MSFFTGRRQNDIETDQISTSQIGFDTVLSASTVLEGTLKSEGNIRLDGQFTGKLDITGNVLVGETAEINADIEARNISIAGTVRGNIIGNKVQLLKTGRIWGDIKSNSLTTEDGAFIEGNIAMHAVPDATENMSGHIAETLTTQAIRDEDTQADNITALEDKPMPDISAEHDPQESESQTE